jgi:hypothetical protein
VLGPTGITVLALACVAGCGGEVQPERGTCFVNVTVAADMADGGVSGTHLVQSWSCITSGIGGDQAGRELPQCPAAVQAGGSCPQVVSTGTNECFACADGGTGTDWFCTDSYGWLSNGTYSCP